MNKADKKLIEDMENGEIYHEYQPDDPHDSRYCSVCKATKRYNKLKGDPS